MTTTTITGDTYRASGAFSPVSTLTAAIGGIVAALVAAGIVWAWERSPIPTLVILTPILQGFALGFALTLLFARAKMRNPTLGFLIGLVCGALSVLAVHYGHYVSNVYLYRDEMRAEAAQVGTKVSPELAQALTRDLEADPYKAYSDWIETIDESGGKRGFLGDLNRRAAMGVSIKSAEVTGKGMWVLWGIEALIVIGIASTMARSRAAEPYCEKCDAWLQKSDTPTVLPPDKAETLAGLVGKGDALGVSALRSSTPAFVGGSGTAGANVHVCPGCEEGYADVVLRVPDKEGKMEEKKILTLAHASKEMLAALRADVKPAEPAPATGAGGTTTTTTAT